MNKFIRFVFLPVFFTAFLSGSVWAAVPNLTGTYQVVGAKYITSTLPSCTGITITVKINSQCGRLLKGSVAIGTTTINVQGRIYNDNLTVSLTGSQPASGSMVFLMGSYQAAPAGIKVVNDTFTFFSPTFPYSDAVFDDFVLLKK